MSKATLARKQKLTRALTGILDRLEARYRPEQVILFGSLAKGRIGRWSDIDLAIIKKTNKRFIDRLKEVAAIARPSVSVNFLVYTPQEVQRMQAQDHPFFIREILAKGKVLFVRDSTN